MSRLRIHGYAASVISHAAIASLILAAASTAQPPPNYYSTVDTSSATALRNTLHPVIDDHQYFPYTSGGTDTWDILEDADEDPNNSGRILDLYRNASYAKAGGGNNNYNREHTWPNSYGFPSPGGSNYPYTDCHQLFLCNISYNNDRNRRPYDNGNSSWNEHPTLLNGGQGGGSGTYPGNSNWRTNSTSPGGWEVWQDRKGDVARALFYLDVRYEGGLHGGTGVNEPDLRLTDNLTLVTQSATGSNESIAYMGKLSVLLQWHAADPVDSKEIARNNAVYSYQGNRNPFIDNPAWVDCIYGSQCGTPHGTRTPEVWINELHYDNVGSDINEFVELAGRAGQSLNGWLLIAYDGTSGNAYDYIHLRGTFPDQQADRGVLSFAFPGLQNGTDGLALVAGNGAVLQLLSYEGTFQANNGAAKGMVSTNIGVAESPATPVGFSLRLSGAGSTYEQFAWQPAFLNSAGAINTAQVFQ